MLVSRRPKPNETPRRGVRVRMPLAQNPRMRVSLSLYISQIILETAGEVRATLHGRFHVGGLFVFILSHTQRMLPDFMATNPSLH